jgi:hypothetical protein
VEKEPHAVDVRIPVQVVDAAVLKLEARRMTPWTS